MVWGPNDSLLRSKISDVMILTSRSRERSGRRSDVKLVTSLTLDFKKLALRHHHDDATVAVTVLVKLFSVMKHNYSVLFHLKLFEL